MERPLPNEPPPIERPPPKPLPVPPPMLPPRENPPPPPVPPKERPAPGVDPAEYARLMPDDSERDAAPLPPPDSDGMERPYDGAALGERLPYDVGARIWPYGALRACGAPPYVAERLRDGVPYEPLRVGYAGAERDAVRGVDK